MATTPYSRSTPSQVPGSRLAAGLVIEGRVTTTEPLVIEGRVTGQVSASDTLEIAADAHVEGPVSARSLRVAGSVQGDVQATDRVDLLASARLSGDIRAPRVSIAEGAAFRGRIDMDV